MKLREFLSDINRFARNNPACLEMDVICSTDDEGNGYNTNFLGIEQGQYEDGEFWGDDSEDGDCIANTVCIN